MRTSRHRPGAPSKRRGIRLILWSAGTLVLLGLGAFFGLRMWIDTYLRSEKFRRFVSQKTSETLHAQGEFTAFTKAGMSFYSEAFKARGGPEAWFSVLQIDQIRADVSARRFFEHVWEIEQVTTDRIDIRVDGSRVELPAERSLELERGPRRGNRWLPNRVEISSAQIRQANLSWGQSAEQSGAVRGTSLSLTLSDGGWNISGSGGQLIQSGYPALEISRLDLRYREPALYVQAAELRQGSNGTVNVTGEVRFGDELRLTAKMRDLPVTPLLADDWRLRVHGDLEGEVTLQAPLPVRVPVTIFGSLTLNQGQLEALPVLDQIALFTRAQQFRRLALTRASADFRRENEKLEVRNFIAESAGLIRVEGSFTVINENLDGTFKVGVSPATLQWLPGSQERVFTEQRGGYVWTPMRLTGPVRKPNEDLSPRLIAAAQSAVLEGVESTVRGTIQTGKDAAKGALDLLMPLFK